MVTSRGEALLITAVTGRPDYPSQSHRAFDQARLDHWQFAYSRACTMTRICKTDQIRATWAAGDRVGALRIAARFFDRSENTRAFKRGIDAFNHPDFYTQLGKEPRELVNAALALLAKRFDLR
jgi:hypothetical protein